MFERKDKDDVCYCEIFKHKKATECIELRCPCCLREDEIRLNHPILQEDDLSMEERIRRENESNERNLEQRIARDWLTN